MLVIIFWWDHHTSRSDYSHFWHKTGYRLTSILGLVQHFLGFFKAGFLVLIWSNSKWFNKIRKLSVLNMLPLRAWESVCSLFASNFWERNQMNMVFLSLEKSSKNLDWKIWSHLLLLTSQLFDSNIRYYIGTYVYATRQVSMITAEKYERKTINRSNWYINHINTCQKLRHFLFECTVELSVTPSHWLQIWKRYNKNI